MPENMPLIVCCTGSNCSYNRNLTCNAMAVTVGGERQALCHTFYQTDRKVAHPESVSFVGACRMEKCCSNRHLECTAFSGVSLVGHNGQVLCHKYKERQGAPAFR